MDRETAVGWKLLEDADEAIMQEQEHMGNVEKAWSATTMSEITLKEVLNAIGDSLSDVASSDAVDDGEDEDDDEGDTGLCKLSEDDQPSWELGSMSKTGHHRMESFWSKEMRLDELTYPAWGAVANKFRERRMKYRITEFQVPAVGKPQTDTTAGTPSTTIFGELKQAHDIIPEKSQMLRMMSQQARSQIRLDSAEPQVDNQMVPPAPNALPDGSQIEIAKPVQPISVFPSIYGP